MATILGEGLTFLLALIYLLKKSSISLKIPLSIIRKISGPVIRVGIAPFGMSLAPNISLVIINWFSIKYGGDRAVATYACISYVICVIYLILQGVGDGSQPLMSRYYGAKNLHKLKITRDMAYVFSLILALLGCFATFYTKGAIGALFGTSASGKCRDRKDNSDLLSFCSVRFNQPHCHCEFLCNRKNRLFICSDVHRTCFDADTDADFAPSVRWTDHGLVEQRFCQNNFCDPGICPEARRRKKRKNAIKLSLKQNFGLK